MSAADRHRWLWHPVLPLLALALVSFNALTRGFTTLRIVGLAVELLWLGLSIYDWRTQGAFRRWLYRKDNDDATN